MEVKTSYFIHGDGILLIIFSCLVVTLATDKPTLSTDQFSLGALQARITAGPDEVLKNWTISSSVCNWIGVSCGKRHHRVTGLNLSSMGLTGSIPPELGNLSFLVSFDIKKNYFEGTLPDDLARLPRLKYMRLSYNDFTGEVPSWLSSFPRLQYLSLAYNNFTGVNPLFKSFSNESKLSSLSVSGIPFLGEFPKSIGKLGNLKVLIMDHNGFSGTLPDNIFTGLPMLEMLSLDGNNIQGQIPSSISECTQLWYLNLGANLFNGTIPEDIGNLNMLEFLEFGLNKLTGKIPPTIGNLSNLISMSFTANKLVGEIPPSICKLSSLVFLDLSSNLLEGIVPNCAGNFSQGLLALYLNYNHLNGPIPTTFAKGCSLKLLSFQLNRFEGPLPKSLTNCTQLKALDIGSNKIQGPFPAWMLETLSELQIFKINTNRFHGTIPEPNEMLSFSKLSVFDISSNGFTGQIPTGYFYNFRNGENGSAEKGLPEYITIQYSGNRFSMEIRMVVFVTLKGDDRGLIKVPRAFNTIDLSNNKFNGNIPNSFGNLTALRHLIVARNNLSGHIPKILGHLTALEALDLSSNHLEGEIPRQLADLTFLSQFNVSYNNLSGEIPYFRQFATFDNDSYVGNFELCGGPLTKKCRKEGVQAPAPSSMVPRDKGIFSNGITWQGVMMGYGFGVLVGVVLGIIYF